MWKITGHRGAAGLEPENTMRSFKKALSLGVDFIEFDVRRTQDNSLIVIHDDTLDRTTDGSGYVKDRSLKEIQKLDAGKGEKIKTLEEVVTYLKNEMPLLTIEIKEPDTLEQILSVIRTNGITEKVVLVSFWHETLKKAKEIEPKIKTGAIIKARPIDTISLLKACNADILCMNHIYIDKRLVEECHRNNIKINAWTVNHLDDIRNVFDLGVDIISTDRPDIVLDFIRMRR